MTSLSTTLLILAAIAFYIILAPQIKTNLMVESGLFMVGLAALGGGIGVLEDPDGRLKLGVALLASTGATIAGVGLWIHTSWDDYDQGPDAPVTGQQHDRHR